MRLNHFFVAGLLSVILSTCPSLAQASVTDITPRAPRPYRADRASSQRHRRWSRELRRDEYAYGSADARYRHHPTRHRRQAVERDRRRVLAVERMLSHPRIQGVYRHDDRNGIQAPSHDPQVRRDEQGIRHQLYTDLQRYRQWHQQTPLQETDAGNRLADERAEQLSTDGFTHYDRHGEQVYLDDERQMHPARYRQYYDADTSENIAQARTDGTAIYHNGSQTIRYHAHNGTGAANEVADMEMLHDQSEQNGHRDNILDSQARYLGIGVYHDPNSGGYDVTEEFSHVRP